VTLRLILHHLRRTRASIQYHEMTFKSMLFVPVSGQFEGLQPLNTVAEPSPNGLANRLVEPNYELVLSGQKCDIGSYLGSGISIEYLGHPVCRHCESTTAKLFRSGYCYSCCMQLARCDLCIVSPERCHFHLDTCREPAWGEQFCMQPHTVYLSNTSGTKVGITRTGRELRRWFDQGAEQALSIISTPTRRTAGYVEVLLKGYLRDQTNWRQLVSGIRAGQNLVELATELRKSITIADCLRGTPADEDEKAQVRWLHGSDEVNIRYPTLSYSPAFRLKVTPEQPKICDNLRGVVGQYLLLTQGVVFLPDYQGLTINMSLGEPFEMPDQPATQQIPLF
jgi:hypothetical protein